MRSDRHVMHLSSVESDAHETHTHLITQHFLDVEN